MRYGDERSMQKIQDAYEGRPGGHWVYCQRCADFKVTFVTMPDKTSLRLECSVCGSKSFLTHAGGGNFVPEELFPVIDKFVEGAIGRARERIKERERKANAPAEPEPESRLSRSRKFRLPRFKKPETKETGDQITGPLTVHADEAAQASRKSFVPNGGYTPVANRKPTQRSTTLASDRHGISSARDKVMSVRTMDDAMKLSHNNVQIARRVLAAAERVRLRDIRQFSEGDDL